MKIISLSILVLLLSIVFMGCSSKKVVVTTVENDNVELLSKDEKEIVELVFRYSSSSCLGKCEVFTFEMLSNGTLTYIGKENVVMKGVFQSFQQKEILSDVIREAGMIKFFSLNEIYPVNGIFLEELPYKDFYLKVGQEEKSIKANHDIPNALKDFEIYLKKIIEEILWVSADR